MLETEEVVGQPETVEPATAYDEQDRLWFQDEVVITHEVVNDLDSNDVDVEITHEIINKLNSAWPDDEYPSHQDWYEVNRDVSMTLAR